MDIEKLWLLQLGSPLQLHRFPELRVLPHPVIEGGLGDVHLLD